MSDFGTLDWKWPFASPLAPPVSQQQLSGLLGIYSNSTTGISQPQMSPLAQPNLLLLLTEDV